MMQWISTYQPYHSQEEILSYYLSQKPPFNPSYHAMQSISELRSIYGMDCTSYQKLIPFVNALPEITPININTAPKTILAILGNGLSAEQIKEIEENRHKKEGIPQNMLELLLKKLDIPSAQVTLESNYFLSIATATCNDANLITYTLLKRTKNREGVISVGVINQSLNTQ